MTRIDINSESADKCCGTEYISECCGIEYIGEYRGIEYIGEYCGSHIYMKRDDKLPFSYGGNKVRIALELVKDIEAGGYDAVISYGSASSNMNRAIADMAKAHNIKCYVIIKTEQAETSGTKGEKDCKAEIVKRTGSRNKAEIGLKTETATENEYKSEIDKKEETEIRTENERLVRASGAELIYCTDSNVRDCVEEAFARAKAAGYKPYYIYGDSTGSGNELSLMRASYNEYAEIKKYELENGIDFDAIVMTAGTGMTIAGFAAAVNDELAGCYPSEGYPAVNCYPAADDFAANQSASNQDGTNSQVDDCSAVNNPAPDGKPAAHAPELIGISAARTTENSLTHIRNDLLTYYKGNESRIMQLPKINDSYLCGGYGRYNAEIESVILDMESKGIALDPCYTGKSYCGMLSEIRSGSLKGRILFIHTGGYPVYLDWKKNR